LKPPTTDHKLVLEALKSTDILTRMKSTKTSYHVVLTPEPEGGFTVSVPTLPGCITYGKTVAEARAMAADAITCYLGSVKKAGSSKEGASPDDVLYTVVTV
jgi:predicted RNase H-like HicB family nuclease